MKKWVVSSLDELEEVARSIIESIDRGSIIYLYGDLGAGKTTLSKMIVKTLGFKGEASSPSYSLVNNYPLKDGTTVYHLDLYRLKDLQEAEDIGIDQYLYPQAYTFIEWPQIIEDITPEHTYTLQIKVDENGDRILHLDTFYE